MCVISHFDAQWQQDDAVIKQQLSSIKANFATTVIGTDTQMIGLYYLSPFVTFFAYFSPFLTIVFKEYVCIQVNQV